MSGKSIGQLSVAQKGNPETEARKQTIKPGEHFGIGGLRKIVGIN